MSLFSSIGKALADMKGSAVPSSSAAPSTTIPSTIAAPAEDAPPSLGLFDQVRESLKALPLMQTESREPIDSTGDRVMAVKMPDNNISKAIDNAASTLGIDRGYMYAMAAQESSFRPEIKAKTSSATGLYQFLDGTWSEVVKRHSKQYPVLLKGRTDPEAAAVGAALYTKQNVSVLKRANIEVNPTTMYAAHFLGAGGARTLWRAKDSAKASEVLPAAAKSNPSVFSGKTVAQVKEFLRKKVGAKADEYNSSFQQVTIESKQQEAPTIYRDDEGKAFQMVEGKLVEL